MGRPYSPQTPELAHARALLAAQARRLDIPAMAAGEALGLLNDVHPPLPPITCSHQPAELPPSTLLEALQHAANTAPDAHTALRIALARQALTAPAVSAPRATLNAP